MQRQVNRVDGAERAGRAEQHERTAEARLDALLHGRCQQLCRKETEDGVADHKAGEECNERPAVAVPESVERKRDEHDNARRPGGQDARRVAGAEAAERGQRLHRVLVFGHRVCCRLVVGDASPAARSLAVRHGAAVDRPWPTRKNIGTVADADGEWRRRHPLISSIWKEPSSCGIRWQNSGRMGSGRLLPILPLLCR